jgi:metal-responsive CopG/Arc/MetJ family transcriptional regulator
MNKQILMSCSIKEDLLKNLDEYADKDDSSRSRIIQIAIKEFLERKNAAN